MRVPKLDEEQIETHLSKLPDWSRSGDEISRTLTFKDFVHAMQFVNQVAEAAEGMNHHPDIDIRYNKVSLTLSTHDVSGLSINDFELAGTADSLFESIAT